MAYNLRSIPTCFFLLSLLAGLLFSCYKVFIEGRTESGEKIVKSLKSHYIIACGAILFFIFAFYAFVSPGASTGDVQASFIIVAVSLLLYGASLYFTKSFSLGSGVFMIIVLGIMLRLSYMFCTPFDARQHDISPVDGHIFYMKYIAAHLQLPATGTGQTYHPPVHYILSAAAYLLGGKLGLKEFYAMKLVQVAMVFLSSVALIYFYKILRLANAKGPVLLSGVALFAFHPTNILFSSFINNDNTMLFFYTLSFYFLLKWMRDNSVRNIVSLALLISLSCLTKISALMIFPVIGTVFLVVLLKNRSSLKTYFTQFAVFLGIAVPLSLIYQVRNSILFKRGLLYILPVDCFKPYPNTLDNLFFFPVQNLFTAPFTESPVGIYEKNRFFLEYLFKSSLYGEFQFPGLESFARFLNFAALALCILLAVYVIRSVIKGRISTEYAFFTNMVIILLFAFINRLHSGVVCGQNFRYLAPILISTSYFAAKAVGTYKIKSLHILKYPAAVLVAGFCLFSTLFFLNIRV